jgi:SAM-dependent methyltransferase
MSAASSSQRPPPEKLYVFDALSDRDRIYLMYDIFHAAFIEAVERALGLAGISLDPAQAAFHLLDVAAGEGLHAAELGERYPRAQVVAFDRDSEAVQTATTTFRDLGNVRFFHHDAMNPLPSELVPAGGFDVAQVRFGLTHFADGVRGLRHIHAALRPGGVIYLVDSRTDTFAFDHPSMHALTQVLNRSWNMFGTSAAGDRHVELLEQAGFTVIDSALEEYPAGGPGSPDFGAFKLMIETLRSMRTALVDRTKLIDGAEFDEHLRRLSHETRADQRGAGRFTRSFARR